MTTRLFISIARIRPDDRGTEKLIGKNGWQNERERERGEGRKKKEKRRGKYAKG